MIKLLKFAAAALFLCCIESCFEKEVYPDVPHIEITNVSFYNNALFDSLPITFRFEDGNGDIWIDQDTDIFYPYNDYLVFIDSANTLVTTANYQTVEPPIYQVQLITDVVILVVDQGSIAYTFGGDNTNHPILGFDTSLYNGDLQNYPLECPYLYNENGSIYGVGQRALTMYTINEDRELVGDTLVVEDAILVEPVESSNNLIIKFARKVLNDQNLDDGFDPGFEEINIGEEVGVCENGVFSTKIPFFESNSQAGTITHTIKSTVLEGIFLEDSIQLKIYVYDRAFNKSNEELFTFRLQDITQ